MNLSFAAFSHNLQDQCICIHRLINLAGRIVKATLVGNRFNLAVVNPNNSITQF